MNRKNAEFDGGIPYHGADEVYALSKKALCEGAQGGGFILGSGDDIPRDAKPEAYARDGPRSEGIQVLGQGKKGEAEMVCDYKRTCFKNITVERTRYIRRPAENAAAVLTHFYTGGGHARREVLTTEAADDVYTSPKTRVSRDNGLTFGPWEDYPQGAPVQGIYSMELFELCRYKHAASGAIVKILFQRIFKGDPAKAIQAYFKKTETLFWDHAFYQLSYDDGETFGPAELIGYEPGGGFDERDWAAGDYLWKNRMYAGYNIVENARGELVFAASVRMAHVKDGKEQSVDGIIVLTGRWDKTAARYTFEKRARLSVSADISSRGLMEPWLAVLRDDKLMLEMRGSCTPETQGRKWKSVSTDGGNSWAEVTELCYSSGERFFAPSSFAKLIRSAKTGRLYWIGNISDTPPEGNWPRRPLCICEVDEERAALVKESVRIIDDYEPGADASERVQFSNFSLLENRETKQLELYLTRYGEFGELGTPEYYGSDVFCYKLGLE